MNVTCTVLSVISFSLLSPEFPAAPKSVSNEPALRTLGQIYHHYKGLYNQTSFSGIQGDGPADLHNGTWWASNACRITDRLHKLGFVLISVPRGRINRTCTYREGFILRTCLWGYETQASPKSARQAGTGSQCWSLKDSAGRIPSSLEDDCFCSRKVFSWLDEDHSFYGGQSLCESPLNWPWCHMPDHMGD